MDIKAYVRVLWTVLLTLFMIFLDADIDEKSLANNSDICVYIFLSNLVFYLICRLLGFGLVYLLVSGIILMAIILTALVCERGYYFILYICIFCIVLLNRRLSRRFGFILKFIVILINFGLLMNILILILQPEI